jgi:hypothetical protein
MPFGKMTIRENGISAKWHYPFGEIASEKTS